MSLPTLPNEIFTEILILLSFIDQKTCMETSQAWYDRFQPSVLQHLSINSRQHFVQFYNKLESSHQTNRPFGLLVRRLRLGPHVGFVSSEFNALPLYCPFLEFLDFNPLMWRYIAYSSTVARWNHLTRLPCMDKLRLAVPILHDTGHGITQLELGSTIVDELAGASHSIISILSFTPSLTSLQLSGGITIAQNISISEFESIHTLCPKLESLSLRSFDSHLKTNDSYLIDIETLPVAFHLKKLRIDISINSEEFLYYWAHKYPHIESLDIQLRLLEPEYYHEAIRPQNSRMKESFSLMATRFTKLRRFQAKFDEKYFPCDVFLRGLNDARAQLKEIVIHFFNFDYYRRSARNFKLLVNNSINTVTNVTLCNWDRSWDYEEDILEPLCQCQYLQVLSLSPQPGTLTEFDFDIILDRFIHLKKLELANTYNLFVRDDGNVNIFNTHRLEELSLKHTMINNRLFEYLAVRCPFLNRLNISNITKPYDNDIQVKIDMPNHSFKSIQIRGLRLGLRIEDTGFQCSYESTLFSLEQTQKVTQRQLRQHRSLYLDSNCTSSKVGSQFPERWYHLYQPTKTRYHGGVSKENVKKSNARLQRLNDEAIHKIKNLQMAKQLWEQISFTGPRIKYEDKSNWYLDIPYGYISVRCNSVSDFSFEGIHV
jgi:hypothetical protein